MATQLARVVGGSGGTSRALVRNAVLLGADYTNSTVTGSSVADLFTPTVAGTWRVFAELLIVSAAATTGVQLALTGSTTGLGNSATRITTASAATTELVTHQAANVYQGAVAGLTTPTLATIDGFVTYTAASGSPVAVSARSEVAGSAIRVLTGSFIEWFRVA